MTAFHVPEVATRFGALDDLAFADGSPVSAHVTRELARNGNRLALAGDFLFGWRAHADTSNPEQGSARLFAGPHWTHLLPCSSVPVPKPGGRIEIGVRMRLLVTSGAELQVYVTTNARPTPENRPSGEILTVTGTGTLDPYTKNDVVAQVGYGERLSFLVKALVDPDNDTALATGTYGAAATGTVDTATSHYFTDASSSWNTSGSMVHSGGHYVVFKDGNDRIVFGPVRITETLTATTLGFWPEVPSRALALRGTTYEIYQLPSVAVSSVVAYAMAGSV